MTLINCKIRKNHKGFSLAELLAALTIGSMILVTVLGIYSRAQRSAAAVTRKIEQTSLPAEILQRIAEDLDNLISDGKDLKINIQNKIESHGFQTAKLEITKTYYDKNNTEKTFEKIIWQANYDYQAETPGMILYRSHSGLTYEDKLLDSQKEDWQRELFVPVCDSLTLFKIEIPQGEIFQNSWSGDRLPNGVVVTISFAQPVKTAAGSFDVPDDQKLSRNIAIDRTRKITFNFVGKDFKDLEKLQGLLEEQTEQEQLDESDTDAEEAEQQDPNESERENISSK